MAGFDEESWKDDRSASPTDLQEDWTFCCNACLCSIAEQLVAVMSSQAQDAAATPAVPELPESMMGEAAFS